MRVIAETLVALLFTALLTTVAIAIFQASDGGGIGTAIDSAWRVTAVGTGAAFMLWTALLLIGNIINRRRSWLVHVVANFSSALLAALINGGVVLLIGLTTQDGFGWLFAVAALAALVAFVVAALISLLLTHLVIVRRAVPLADAPELPAESAA